MKDHIVLLSGGLDSVSMYFYLLKKHKKGNLIVVYYDLKTKYSKKEIIHLRKLSIKHNIDIIWNEDLSYLGKFENGPKANIPYRNLVLAINALQYGENDEKCVYLGGVQDDVSPDKTEYIFNRWSKVLTETNGGNKVEVLSPFWNMTKVDVAKWMRKEYPKIDLDDDTLSCYENGPGQCNGCPACWRRNTALYQIGYELPFNNSELANSYYHKIGDGTYDPEREQYMKEYYEYLINNSYVR